MGVYILDGKKKVDCKYPQISEGMLTDSNNYNFTDPNVQLQNSAKKKRHTHKLASQIKFTFRKGISV
jgi:hypothetical protein